MSQTTLTVPDISCGHCKESIEGAVGALPGVQTVTVEIEPKTVNLEFDDSAVTIEEITAAIEAVGYEVPDRA